MEAQSGQPIPSTTASPALPGAGDQGMGMPIQMPAATPAAPAVPVQTAQRGHFFSGIDWTEVLMLGLVGFAMAMSIYGSYQHIVFLRDSKKAHGQDIDEIKSNLQTVMGDQYQSYST
jgi:hypothetical protein